MLTQSLGGIVHSLHPPFMLSGPTLPGRSRTWGKRVHIFVQEVWAPVPLSISCEIVQKNVSVWVWRCTFRGLTAQGWYLRPFEPEEAKLWALIYFAAWWCASQDNQAGSISGTLAVIQYFHRVDVVIELYIRSPLIKSALQGILRWHTLAGTRSPVRLPLSWDMMIKGQELISSWSFGSRYVWARAIFLRQVR